MKNLGISVISAVLLICASPDAARSQYILPNPWWNLWWTGLVFIEPTGRFFPLGSQGPCGNNMVVTTLDQQTKYGTCGCRQTNQYERPIVYLEQKNQCECLYDQGSCTKGDWLVPDGQGSGKCEQIPCWSDFVTQSWPIFSNGLIYPSGFLFPYEGRCYRMPNNNFPACSGQKVYPDRVQGFRCGGDKKDRPASTFDLTGTSPLKCATGSVPLGKDCVPQAIIQSYK